MELNQNILCHQRLSRLRVRNPSETDDSIMLKLSAGVEGDVEETKQAMHILVLFLLQILLQLCNLGVLK